MEEGWERPPHVVPTPAEVAAHVAAAFPGRVLARYELLTTGLANTNLRLWLRGDPQSYVLRYYARDPAALARESSLMSLLRRQAPNVPVPTLIHTGNSPGPYSVWTFVEGTLLQDSFRTASSEELCRLSRACGRTLAALAAVRFESCGELGEGSSITRHYGAPSDFVPALVQAGLAGLPGQRLGRHSSERLRTVVERTAPLLRELDGAYSLVHGDYKRSNLLVCGHGSGARVAAVLDWEFACAGPPLIDFGLFLRAGSALPAGFREAFAEGYVSAGGTLPERWLPLSRLVDLVSQMTFLDGRVERPRVWAETVRVVEESVRVLSAL